MDIINETSNPDIVIDILHKVADGTGQPGRDKKGKQKKGEEALCLPDWKIETLADDVLSDLTGTVVFIL